MADSQDGSLGPAFDKDPLELGVEDVYDISYVIGKDLFKLNSGGQEVSDLQFKIVRVLEMFEIMVSKYNLSLEELRMERDNLKGELDRVVEGSHENGNNIIGLDKLVIDMKDPNRPRFTMQELKEVLQERNQLKAQLLVAQEELQLYKSGVLPQPEPNMVEIDLGTPSSMDPPLSAPTKENKEQHKEERTTIQKLLSPTSCPESPGIGSRLPTTLCRISGSHLEENDNSPGDQKHILKDSDDICVLSLILSKSV